MSLGSKVWINQKKRWTGPFKVLSIANIDIIVDMGNGLVTFQNTHIRLYNCQTKEININYLETVNSLAEILLDKPANEEISIPLDYLKP